MSAHEPEPLTAGHTIAWASHYDKLLSLLTLGRAAEMWQTAADLAELSPGEAVLDVGCGTGELAMVLRERLGASGAVTGVDASPQMIALARQKAARAETRIDYRAAAAEALPFPDATFDAVVSSLMMHHLPDDAKRAALAEMRRVLKAGGRLLLLDLKRPHGTRDRLSLPMLLHRGLRTGAPELVPLVEAAGFTDAEAGDTTFRFLGYVRGRKRGRSSGG
jgi:demethylmenaquinone methyltransferase/2-methoxy-6-polyprenyl-1,4-benzoquinol methylase/phosphoethanolamine N-methyltransferase